VCGSPIASPQVIKQIVPFPRMSKQPTNIHDAFFKRVMGEPECAGLFLREHLPPEIASLLSEDPPEPQPGSFVDEDLAQHQTDLLLKVRLKEGEALAYILAEHKSAPDPLARLQLLRVLRADLLEHLDQVLAEARSLDRLDLSLVLKYIAMGAARVDRQLLRGRLRRMLEKAEMFDRRIADAEFEEAVRHADFYWGKASALIQVLELRFGPLTETFRGRIYDADVPSIEAWLTRAIKENTLQGVFD
jgi:hypothetical protein